MIVGVSFTDDSTDVGRIQHDVYGEALLLIREECRAAMVRAATILDVQPSPGATVTVPIDHRTLQMAHDMIAAAWRYRAQAAQTVLPLTGTPPDTVQDCLGWLRAELRSWVDEPLLIRLVLEIVAHQNTAPGYAAEDALTLALLRRYADVPWSPAWARLSAGLSAARDPEAMMSSETTQHDLFPLEDDRDRALIEQLIAATRLYETSEAVKELMEFAVRLRRFAPFNGLLLHNQKPGLTYAASAREWFERFGRVPKKGRRPLLILRTMGPVDFVFDILDTEGRDLPESAFSFPTLGLLTESRFKGVIAQVAKLGIEIVQLDAGDASAGWISLARRSSDVKRKHHYQLAFNSNHPAPTRLVTVAHELAHLFLGHLGDDAAFKIRDRRHKSVAEKEVEAEMAAFLVAKRNGLTPRSESYLTGYRGAISHIDLYAVMRVANAIETAMGIAAHQMKGATP